MRVLGEALKWVGAVALTAALSVVVYYVAIMAMAILAMAKYG